jgi:hypothetical protein
MSYSKSQTKEIKQDEYNDQEEGVYSENVLADRALGVACKQFKTAVEFQQPRFDEILKNEEMYAGKTTPALKGRNNVPFDGVIMSGFVNTLISKIDEPLNIEYTNEREQDKKAAEKLKAVFDVESSADYENWEAKDLDSKRLATTSGRGFFKFFAENDPKFKTTLEVPDHFDMYTEPQGGRYLDKHLFKGQQNIFRTQEDLQAGAESGYYDKKQVRKLIAKMYQDAEGFKETEDLYKNKVNFLQSRGLNPEMYNYVGSKLFKLNEHVMYFAGDWYYMVFDYKYNCWLKFEKLEDVFSVAKDYPGRGPWVSWATDLDPHTFWSKAPADDVRPIAASMKKIFNLTLDNLEKRNWDMKAYDSRMFPDASKLKWKQNGLVKANLSNARGLRNISEGIYEFQTPDTTNISINMFEFLNNFIGENTGITPGTKGKSEDEKVGIYYGNLEAVADRLGLTNKMYKRAYEDLGVMFKYGVYDNLREPYAVKLIGLKGVEWDESLSRQEAAKPFRVSVSGGNDEQKNNTLLAQRRDATLARIEKNPKLMEEVNTKWYLRELLSNGGFEKEDIRIGLDPNTDADQDLLSEAAMAIDEIIQGGDPDLNQGATSGYVQKIMNFAEDNRLDDDVRVKLVFFARQHLPIMTKNMARKAMFEDMQMQAQQMGQPQPQQAPKQLGPGGNPAPESPNANVNLLPNNQVPA